MVEVCNKNFDNGKVYCIRNFVNKEVYVGSTCQPLSKRMAKHRSSINTTAKKHRRLYQEMNKLGADQFYIELLEEVNCNNIEQLRKKEGEYIRSIGTLNSLVNGRTKEELTQTQEYKDKKKEQNRNWYLNNRDYALEYSKEYRENHKEEYKEWKKQHYERNKDKISQEAKQRILCDCGLEVCQGAYTRHCKSKHHQNYLNNNIDNVQIPEQKQ